MVIVHNQQELYQYVTTAVKVSPRHPVLVDQYVKGIEVEVDAISDGRDVLIPGIMEHIERAGVHSGDSIAVYPAQSLQKPIEKKIENYTYTLAKALHVKGLINIQFVVRGDEVYVLEVNPRASRTVPYISKVTGIPMVNIATKALMGQSLEEMGYSTGVHTPPDNLVAIKVPVFSFAKLSRVDTTLGPEMKSTGEVMGIDATFENALAKGLLAAGLEIPENGVILTTVADKDKEEALPVIKGFSQLGFRLCATGGTAAFLRSHGLDVEKVSKLREGRPNIVDLIREGKIHFVFNTFTKGRQLESDGFAIRRAAVEHGIPCLTSLDTFGALLRVMKGRSLGKGSGVMDIHDYVS